MNHQEQLEALAHLVAEWAVKKDRNVKGPFTSGDFVTFTLNKIFSPAGWSFTILSGPEMITISDNSAYARIVGRLEVRFADGWEQHQDDVGIWPLKASQGQDLAATQAERYETCEKAARTDCLKNAARNLGSCFAPLTDLELQAAIRNPTYQKPAQATPRPASVSPAQDLDDLFGSKPAPAPTAAEAKAAAVTAKYNNSKKGKETDEPAGFYALAPVAIAQHGLSDLVNELVQAPGSWSEKSTKLREAMGQ